MLGAIIPIVLGAGSLLAAATSKDPRAEKARKIAKREATKTSKLARKEGKRRADNADAERKKKKKDRRDKITKGRKAPKPPKPPKHDEKKPAEQEATHKVNLESDKKPEPKKSDKPKKKQRRAKAAAELFDYVTEVIRAGHSRQLGNKGNPNEKVKTLQAAMAHIEADGIYSTETRKRGQELLGKPFPQRVAPKPGTPPKAAPKAAPSPAAPPKAAPSPAAPPKAAPSPAAPPKAAPAAPTRTPQEAALDLLQYVRGLGNTGRAKALGYKGFPSPVVLAAQQDMGGMAPDDVDGIYATATRARGKALTGQNFPMR